MVGLGVPGYSNPYALYNRVEIHPPKKTATMVNWSPSHLVAPFPGWPSLSRSLSTFLGTIRKWEESENCQWLFLVPLKGGRWHIIPQLALYTTYIPLIVLAFWGLYAAYHLLGEPETTIETGCQPKNRGDSKPPKWMVSVIKMEKPILSWMIWGYTIIFGNT